MDCPKVGLMFSEEGKGKFKFQRGEWPTVPPVRFAVEFKNASRLLFGYDFHSKPIFYGGSYWSMAFRRNADESPVGRVFFRKSKHDSDAAAKIDQVDKPIEAGPGVSRGDLLKSDYTDEVTACKTSFKVVHFHGYGMEAYNDEHNF